MARTLGVHYIMNKVYKSLAMEGQWLNTFGALSDPFTMLVFGHPKNGKTSFMMMFAKYLTNFGKVFVCWETAGKPSGKFAKDIEFIVDVVVHVSNFKAYPRSRFGGNQEFMIWDKKPVKGEQLKMMVA